jgi:hypothetical protein
VQELDERNWDRTGVPLGVNKVHKPTTPQLQHVCADQRGQNEEADRI